MPQKSIPTKTPISACSKTKRWPCSASARRATPTRSTSRTAASRSSSAFTKGSKSIPVAKEKGFEVVTTAEAVKRADVILVALPDTKQPAATRRTSKPNLTKGKTLLFSHGFSIHFKTIVPPKNVNIIMVAPKGPGHTVRRQYTEGKGVPSLIAVYQNPGKEAKKIALAWAKGIGGTRAGVSKPISRKRPRPICSANRPCSAAARARWCRPDLKCSSKPVTRRRWPTFECLHELKLIADLMNEAGISGMRFSISETAKWGDVSVGPKIIDASVKKRMKAALKDIQSGKFAKGWVAEYEGRLQEIQRAAQSRAET
jgi:ketol-acid reductoisomerase